MLVTSKIDKSCLELQNFMQIQESLVGKKLIIVANLKPRKMRGEISQGMILSAEAPDGTLKVVEAPADMPNGAIVG
jgi:methionyl-tRNA synthetase